MSTLHQKSEALYYSTGKPEVIIDYNKTQGSVYTVDKMCAEYNCARPTRRCCNKLIYYREFSIRYPKENTKKNFCGTLGYELLDDQIRRRILNERIPKFIRLRIKEIFHIKTENIQPVNPMDRQRGRCFHYSWQKNRLTRFNCHKCQKCICFKHAKYICQQISIR